MIMLQFIGTILYYLFIVSFFVLVTPFCLLTWLITMPFDPLKKIPHSINTFIARVLLLINPFWRFKVEGRENIDPKKVYVVAANHQSLADILVLYLLSPLQFKFVAKKELTYVPFVGWVMSLAKYVLLDRRNPKSQFMMMRTCEHYLERGMSIGIFPEGTRSKTGELKKFKDGASMLAKTTKSDILPVCMVGNNKAMPTKGFIWKNITHMTVKILPAIEYDENIKTKELTKKVQELINLARS